MGWKLLPGEICVVLGMLYVIGGARSMLLYVIGGDLGTLIIGGMPGIRGGNPGGGACSTWYCMAIYKGGGGG